MTLLGMDVDEVERIAHDLMQNQFKVLEGVLTAISGHVGTLPNIWHGHDSEQFINDWETNHKPALTSLMQRVEHLGQTALRQAADQRANSNS